MTSKPQIFRIRDEDISLSRDDVLAVARREMPRRVNAYFVEIEGRRFPPKQLLRSASRTAKEFDTGVALRILRSLGFQVVKVDRPA